MKSKVDIIDFLTVLYFLSLVAMGIVTNVRPMFINHWILENHNSTNTFEMDSNTFVLGMITNQIIIMMISR